MGFWDVLGRMIQGKPAFIDPEAAPKPTSDEPAEVAVSTPEFEQESGRKIIPQVKLEHTRSRVSGNLMLVTAQMTNMSDSAIELEKISLLGQTYRIDRQLPAHGWHEVRLYEGPLAQDESHKKAELYYQQVATNDYFCADFVVKYRLESSGGFTISQFSPERYVRDI